MSDNPNRLPESGRRTCKIAGYYTAGEQTAIDTLARPYGIRGRSAILREAFGHFIRTKHPELINYLRDDLRANNP